MAGRLATINWPLGCIQIMSEMREALARNVLYLCFGMCNYHAVRTRNMKVQGENEASHGSVDGFSEPLVMLLTGANEMRGVKNGVEDQAGDDEIRTRPQGGGGASWPLHLQKLHVDCTNCLKLIPTSHSCYSRAKISLKGGESLTSP